MKSVFLCEPVDNVFEGRTSLVLCLDPQENEAEDSLWEFEPVKGIGLVSLILVILS